MPTTEIDTEPALSAGRCTVRGARSPAQPAEDPGLFKGAGSTFAGLWPRDRLRRVRNVAFLVFMLPGTVIHFTPYGLATRLAALVGMMGMVVFVVYAYEAWRRHRRHEDTWCDDKLVSCSDPASHAFFQKASYAPEGGKA